MDEEQYKEMKEDLENGDLDTYYGNEEDTFWLGVRYGQAILKYEPGLT